MFGKTTRSPTATPRGNRSRRQRQQLALDAVGADEIALDRPVPAIAVAGPQQQRVDQEVVGRRAALRAVHRDADQPGAVARAACGTRRAPRSSRSRRAASGPARSAAGARVRERLGDANARRASRREHLREPRARGSAPGGRGRRSDGRRSRRRGRSGRARGPRRSAGSRCRAGSAMLAPEAAPTRRRRRGSSSGCRRRCRRTPGS